MADAAQVADLLEKRGLRIIGTVISNPSNPNAYFVPLRLTWSANGGKSPSGRALADARSILLKQGYVVDFILIDEKSQRVEESLRAGLLSSFPDDVRNSFFSPSRQHPHAWVEFKRPPDAETTRRLREHLRRFAAAFSLPSLSMATVGSTNTATNTDILSGIRQLSPVDVPALVRELEAHGHAIPSIDWTNRRLDALHKSGLVLRRHDGTYVLTTDALKRLGTRKSRRSPDVRRFLALARRGA
jgi:hypothetical protein